MCPHFTGEAFKILTAGPRGRCQLNGLRLGNFPPE